ncbi:adenylyl-sulfate kinase [Trinickia symbiotica]|uniref:Adenylyl-sulfate kinase n=1 Tax=Trinickia symbiotica TaxID=863227 RepID=A0A2T3XXK5_9BURK|nr:adenylyl-sulfate kinase [Trinickia symbiotica]
MGPESGSIQGGRDASRARAWQLPSRRMELAAESYGGVLWMTGLSGAGKSTLANALKEQLEADRYLVTVLDGDILRTGLNAGLGFSDSDRRENIRRTAEVAAMFKRAGFIVIAALISPIAANRALARTIVGERFFEVHVDSSLEVCESRDPKGLYAKARNGELREFTGITSPYEAPTSPDLVIDTSRARIADSVAKLAGFIDAHIEGRRFER